MVDGDLIVGLGRAVDVNVDGGEGIGRGCVVRDASVSPRICLGRSRTNFGRDRSLKSTDSSPVDDRSGYPIPPPLTRQVEYECSDVREEHITALPCNGLYLPLS